MNRRAESQPLVKSLITTETHHLHHLVPLRLRPWELEPGLYFGG